MSRSTPLLLTLIAGLVLTSPALAERFYRWTDDKGVTHFSQSPPPEGVEAKEVRTRNSASSDQEEAIQDLQQRRQAAAEQRQRAAQQQQEAARETAEPDAVRQERCELHRKNLEELRNRPIIRTEDPATGEVITLDEEARQKAIRDAEEALKLCN